MRACTSTASISYITKHASFDKELKSPNKLNGGRTRCLQHPVRSSSNAAGCSSRQCTHSLHIALSMRSAWTYLHNECCGHHAVPFTASNVTVPLQRTFYVMAESSLLNKGSKLKTAHVNIGAFFKRK